MKGGTERSKKLDAETLKTSSEQENNASTKKSWRWTKEQSTPTSTGSSATPLNEHQIARQVSWPISERRRWTNTCKASNDATIITKPWSRISCNPSYCPMFSAADLPRRCSSSKEDSRRRPRSHSIPPSPRLPLSLWRINDCCPALLCNTITIIDIKKSKSNDLEV